MSLLSTKALVVTLGQQMLVAGMPAVQNVQNASVHAPSLDEIDHWLHLAFAAYCPESEIKEWNCGAHCDAVTGLSMIQYIEKTGYTDNVAFAAFVAYDSQAGEIILSFKGSDNDVAFIEDWLTNFDKHKIQPIEQYPKANVHRGFWNAWQSLKPDVLSAINTVTAEHSGATAIRVTGHSLGSAMATNAAMDLKLNHGFVTSVVNFGSPRAGDLDYSEAVLKEVPHWRVTHHNDPVPHTPPKRSGFHHVATEVYFPDETGLEFRICDGSGEDESCAISCAPLSCTSVDDHLNYLDQGITCGSSSVVV